MENGLVFQNMPNYGYNPAMYNTGMTMPMSMPTGINMGMPNGMMPVNDYSKDVFAPDFIKNPYNNIWQGNNTQNYTQNTQNQSIFNNQQNTTATQTQTFSGNETTTPEQQNPEPTENENLYEKTNTFKKLGATAGISIPLLTTGYKVLKGAKFSDIVKYKELGIKGLALGIAGWCAGAIIDGFINSNKAQTADKAA